MSKRQQQEWRKKLVTLAVRWVALAERRLVLYSGQHDKLITVGFDEEDDEYVLVTGLKADLTAQSVRLSKTADWVLIGTL